MQKKKPTARGARGGEVFLLIPSCGEPEDGDREECGQMGGGAGDDHEGVAPGVLNASAGKCAVDALDGIAVDVEGHFSERNSAEARAAAEGDAVDPEADGPPDKGVGELVDRDHDEIAEEPAEVHQEEGDHFVVSEPRVVDASAFDLYSASGHYGKNDDDTDEIFFADGAIDGVVARGRLASLRAGGIERLVGHGWSPVVG